jgi:hypothetical protein
MGGLGVERGLGFSREGDINGAEESHARRGWLGRRRGMTGGDHLSV